MQPGYYLLFKSLDYQEIVAVRLEAGRSFGARVQEIQTPRHNTLQLLRDDFDMLAKQENEENRTHNISRKRLVTRCTYGGVDPLQDVTYNKTTENGTSLVRSSTHLNRGTHSSRIE